MIGFALCDDAVQLVLGRVAVKSREGVQVRWVEFNVDNGFVCRFVLGVATAICDGAVDVIVTTGLDGG